MSPNSFLRSVSAATATGARAWFLAAAALLACACSGDSEEEAGGAVSAVYTNRTRLTASSDPIELRLAAVEQTFGTSLRAYSVWSRDSGINGRDLWVTIRTGASTRAWLTREDVRSLDAVQFTSTGTRVVATRDEYQGNGYEGTWPATTWLDLTLDVQGDAIGTTLGVTKRQLAFLNPYAYEVEASDDEFGAYLARVEDMRRVENADAMVRVFHVGATDPRAADDGHAVLVLTDREAHHVFPLAIRSSGIGNVRFVDRQAISLEVYEAADGREGVASRYTVTWDRPSAPSIQSAR